MIGSTNQEKLFALVGLHQFSAERQLYTLRALGERIAGVPTLAELKGLVDEAIDYNDETLEMRDGLRRRGDGRNRHEDGAAEVDRVLDKALSGLATRIQGEVDALEPEHPRAIQAAALLARLFPDGVAAVTKRPYVEQASEVRKLLDRVEGPLAREVERFGLEPLVERIQRLYKAYIQVLGPNERPEVTRRHIREREREGDTKLRYIAAYILVHFGRPGVDDDEDCERLLGPILAQNEDLSALLKDRRAGRKVKNRLQEPAVLDGAEDGILEESPIDELADSEDGL